MQLSLPTELEKTTRGNKMLDISGVNVSAANAQCVSSWNFGMVNSGHLLIQILATLHAKNLRRKMSESYGTNVKMK